MCYNIVGDYVNRIDRLYNFLDVNDLNGVLIHNLANVFYFSGFTGSSASLLMTKEENYLLTDFRYIDQAKEESLDFEVIETNKEETIDVIVNRLRRKHKIFKLGLEGDYLSRNQWLNYERNLTSRLIDVDLNPLRMVKDDSEISLIKKAIDIAEKAFLITIKEIKAGVSEKSIARLLEYTMLQLGAEKIAFDTIVASGERGSLPHGRASDKIIKNNELVTIDFGCVYKGYCSDMTRTIAIGEVDEKLKEIYDIVLEANKLGINKLKANIEAREVDKKVRDYISKHGYKDNFGHGLGHSLGIEVHENPRLNQISEDILQAGNIVTIEPGIYVSGLGGVRIEDVVLIKNDGIEVLTSLKKELFVIQEEK